MTRRIREKTERAKVCLRVGANSGGGDLKSERAEATAKGVLGERLGGRVARRRGRRAPKGAAVCVLRTSPAWGRGGACPRPRPRPRAAPPPSQRGALGEDGQMQRVQCPEVPPVALARVPARSRLRHRSLLTPCPTGPRDSSGTAWQRRSTKKSSATRCLAIKATAAVEAPGEGKGVKHPQGRPPARPRGLQRTTGRGGGQGGGSDLATAEGRGQRGPEAAGAAVREQRAPRDTCCHRCDHFVNIRELRVRVQLISHLYNHAWLRFTYILLRAWPINCTRTRIQNRN